MSTQDQHYYRHGVHQTTMDPRGTGFDSPRYPSHAEARGGSEPRYYQSETRGGSDPRYYQSLPHQARSLAPHRVSSPDRGSHQSGQPQEDFDVSVQMSVPGTLNIDNNNYSSKRTVTRQRVMEGTSDGTPGGAPGPDGKCTCCPYGYHIDLDFVRYVEDTQGSGNQTVLRQLKQIKRDKKKLRKNMEVYLDQQDGYCERGDPPPDVVHSADQNVDHDTHTNRTLRDIDSSINKSLSVRRETTSTTRRLDFESDGSPSPVSSPMSPNDPRPLGHGYRTDSMTSLASNTTLASEVSHITSVNGTRYTSVTAQLASILAQYLPRPDPSGRPVSVSHEALSVLRQQFAISLQKIRDLEEQVKQVPVMQVRMSVLKEEKRLLMLQLKARQNKLNVRSIGVSNDRIDAGPFSPQDAAFGGNQFGSFSRTTTSTTNSYGYGPDGRVTRRPEMRSIGVGGGTVEEKYDLQPSLVVQAKVSETERESNIEKIIREKEIHTIVVGQENQSPYGSLSFRRHSHDRRPTTRSVGVGDNNVFETGKMQVQEKELRTIIIGQDDKKQTRNVGVSVRVPVRDVGVHYRYEEDKPQMCDVSVSAGTRDAFANQQMFESYYAKTLMETITTGSLFGNAEIKKWVMSVLKRDVRSQATQVRPEVKNQGTATSRTGEFQRSLGVGEDTIDVEVRPIVRTKTQGVSCSPQVSSKWTWMDNLFTIDSSTNTEPAHTKPQATSTVPVVTFPASTNTERKVLYNTATETDLKMFIALEQIRSVGCNTMEVYRRETGVGTHDNQNFYLRHTGVNTDRIHTRTQGSGDCSVEDWEAEQRAKTEIVRETEPVRHEEWTVTSTIKKPEIETLTTFTTTGEAMGYMNRYGERGKGGTIDVEKHITRRVDGKEVDGFSKDYTSGAAVRDLQSPEGTSREDRVTAGGGTVISESRTETGSYGGGREAFGTNQWADLGGQTIFDGVYRSPLDADRMRSSYTVTTDRTMAPSTTQKTSHVTTDRTMAPSTTQKTSHTKIVREFDEPTSVRQTSGKTTIVREVEPSSTCTSQERTSTTTFSRGDSDGSFADKVLTVRPAGSHGDSSHRSSYTIGSSSGGSGTSYESSPSRYRSEHVTSISVGGGGLTGSTDSSRTYRSEQTVITGGGGEGGSSSFSTTGGGGRELFEVVSGLLEDSGSSSFASNGTSGGGVLSGSTFRGGEASIDLHTSTRSSDGQTVTTREQKTEVLPGGGQLRTEKVTVNRGSRNSRDLSTLDEMLCGMPTEVATGSGTGGYKAGTSFTLSSSGGSSSEGSSGFGSGVGMHSAVRGVGTSGPGLTSVDTGSGSRVQETTTVSSSSGGTQLSGGGTQQEMQQRAEQLSEQLEKEMSLMTNIGALERNLTISEAKKAFEGRGQRETDIDADLRQGHRTSTQRTTSGSSSGSGAETGLGVKSILKSAAVGSQRKGITFADGTVGGSASCSSDSEESDLDLENGASSSSSYDEGSYDGTLGNIIYTCKDDELITRREQGARMFEQNIRETYELSPQMQQACDTLNDDTVRPGSAEAERLLQQEWFKSSSQKLSDANMVEDFLSGFAEYSKDVMEKILNMADQNGNTALHYAVSHGNFDVAGLLLDTGLMNVNKSNNAGYNAIMLASLADVHSEDQKDVVRRMFDLGDINQVAAQAGQTALMLAVSHGRAEMVRHLLEAGANINAQDEDGSTALMCASEHGHSDIVKMLLAQQSCDHNLKDNDGSTALSIAMEAGHKDVGVLLYARSNYNLPPSTFQEITVEIEVDTVEDGKEDTTTSD